MFEHNKLQAGGGHRIAQIGLAVGEAQRRQQRDAGAGMRLYTPRGAQAQCRSLDRAAIRNVSAAPAGQRGCHCLQKERRAAIMQMLGQRGVVTAGILVE